MKRLGLGLESTKAGLYPSPNLNNGDEKLINTFVLKKNFDYDLFYFKIIFIKKIIIKTFL